MLLCTLDITSLYTNIPHNEGIQSNKEMLAIHKPPDSLPHNCYIIELLELVLTSNHFEFQWQILSSIVRDCNGHKVGTFICQFIYD